MKTLLQSKFSINALLQSKLSLIATVFIILFANFPVFPEISPFITTPLLINELAKTCPPEISLALTSLGMGKIFICPFIDAIF